MKRNLLNQAAGTYAVTIFDGHANAGDGEVTATTMTAALQKAETWAQAGDWDHPGMVEIRVTAPNGESQYRTIAVGE